MPSNPKSRSRAKSTQAAGSALDSEQQQLREEQRKLEAQIDELQKTITEAPQRAAEARRRSQQAVFAAAPRPGTYLHGATMLDTRHVEAAAASGRVRRTDGRKQVVLRGEKVIGRQQTLLLLIVLAFALFWAASHFLP